jgi:Holliday junction resolvase RusA-like endonuclease
MPNSIHLTIPGEPRGKERPRFTRQGIAYTPKETVEYENLIRRAYLATYGNRPMLSGKRNIECIICAYFSIPKSTPKRLVEAMLAGQIRPTKTPDTDNVVKIVKDALNRLKDKKTGKVIFTGAYDDDSRVVDLRAGKWYGETARVEVWLREVDAPMPVMMEGSIS